MTQFSIYGRPVLYKQIPRIDPAIVQGLEQCGVATVVEALGPFAGPQQCMTQQMVRRTTRKRIVGPAVTVMDAIGDNIMMHAALDVAQKGDILVVTCGGTLGAQWGEMVSSAAVAREFGGAVIDGAARDLDPIEELGFPVWSTAVSPLGPRKDVLGYVNRPVNCAGVRVAPGDIVVADGDGVVVVPWRQAEAVLNSAKQRLERETTIRQLALSKGQLPGEHLGIYTYLKDKGLDIKDGVWYEDEEI
ncbi:4-carboxy-4-hydroxy-2-oxoadipate aldolase/oxaloacetate decarboxylase [Alicyclobacillus tolerans]|uniref:RraA family protein n=1 Tax=Alicyclobacillus tolerans TaxID=90970 RepID=UPI001F43323C|nr:4-carboxy-4-hydroxy-2-oxoadipate aldolase/oxaloacetate decarboxylase [Alicyclobacillus tolerans]MCF8563163.1 4-carboxy-4-hydroxy-2-oxoadipate aldolase/oxaloacetate decarboxylase [Alicyclobacillus tolerans]